MRIKNTKYKKIYTKIDTNRNYSIDIDGNITYYKTSKLNSIFCEDKNIKKLYLSDKENVKRVFCSYNEYLEKIVIRETHTELSSLYCDHSPNLKELYIPSTIELNILQCDINLKINDISKIKQIQYIY